MVGDNSKSIKSHEIPNRKPVAWLKPETFGFSKNGRNVGELVQIQKAHKSKGIERE